jgi:hypothetical protein
MPSPVPPAVPALPDTQRITTYTLSSQTGPFAVNFAIYGDGNDYTNWIEVWLNDVKLNAAQYTLTSPSGSISTIPRPITDAVITLTTSSSGALVILGDRRPRRLAQFAENRGVPARDLNQALTDIVADQRETWDFNRTRQLYFPGGETVTTLLPNVAARANKFLAFDGAGNPLLSTGTGGGGGGGNPPGGAVGNVQINAGAGVFGGITDVELAARVGAASGGIPAVTPKQFGAFGNGTHPITPTDIANNPQWIGPFAQSPHTTYPVGTEWDVVGIQECFYACFASASTPGSVVWNYTSGRNNRMMFVPAGQYQLNRQVVWSANGWTIQFEDRLTTTFIWNGYGFITGDLTNLSQTITNISPTDIAKLHVGMYLCDGRLQQDAGALNLGAQINSINVGAGSCVVNSRATANVSACSLYMQTSAMMGDGAAYGLGINIALSAGVNMPFNSTNAGNDCALLVFDKVNGTGLAPQQNCLINPAIFGNNHAATGMAVVPVGVGGAQGSEFTYVNPYFSSCTESGLSITGTNALHHEIFGGDWQFCQGYGINCFGSVNVYSSSFQNQLFNFFFSPQTTQLVLDTYDILANGVGGPNQAGGIHNIRSEGNKAVKSTQGGATVYGYTLSGLDAVADWGATSGQRQGDVITPSVNNAKSRVFMCVDAGGPDNSWHMLNQSPPGADTIRVTPSPGYTVNALVGMELWYRFGSNGFTSTFGINSNTADTITCNGSGIGTQTAPDTIIFVSGLTGGSAPNFDAAANGFYVGEGTTDQGFGTAAGSAQLGVGSDVYGSISVNDFVVIPDADQIGVFTDTGTIQRKWPLIAKVLSKDGASGAIFLVTVNKAAKFYTGLRAGSTGGRGVFGTPISDSNMKWMAFPFYCYWGIDILEYSQSIPGSRLHAINYMRYADIENSYTDELIPWDQGVGGASGNQFTNLQKGASWKFNQLNISTATPLNIGGYLRLGDVLTLTPTQNQTLTFTTNTGSTAGVFTQEITLLVITSGTTSFTITFGTNFKSSGTLATGTVDSKTFILKFVLCNGLLYETSRIGPL